MARAPKGKKARKAAPVKARVKKRSLARLQAIAPDTGPVTLEEARSLARAKRPTLAFQDVGKAAAPPASPAAVGAARQKLKKEQRDERARRIREYKATMEIMKRRGARRPRPKGLKADGGEPTAEDEGSFVPLQFFLGMVPELIFPTFGLSGLLPKLMGTGSYLIVCWVRHNAPPLASTTPARPGLHSTSRRRIACHRPCR